MKNRFFQIYYLLALIVIIVNSVYLVKENFIININNVPDGEYQYEAYSPDGERELKVYFVKLSVGSAVRVTETDSSGTRNIFWQTGADDVQINWKDSDTVVINGIDLDLDKGEYFDCRSISSIFSDGLMG